MRNLFFVLLIFSFNIFSQGAVYIATAAPDTEIPVRSIGTSQSWHVYTTKEGVRYMLSYPISQEGTYTRRGKPYLMISNFGENRIELMVHVGYSYNKEVPVEAVINLTKKDPNAVSKFNLIPQGENAWIASAAEEKQIIEKLKNGDKVSFYGESQKKTNSTDVYSLDGFTDAYKKITGKEN